VHARVCVWNFCRELLDAIIRILIATLIMAGSMSAPRPSSTTSSSTPLVKVRKPNYGAAAPKWLHELRDKRGKRVTIENEMAMAGNQVERRFHKK